MGLQFIRDTLGKHGLRLQRERGQNFLVEEGMADRLAQLSGVQEGDRVIEVGTGLGVLTRALAARAARVTTIEIDSGLVKVLRSEELLPANVELIHADALEVDLLEQVERMRADPEETAPEGVAVRVVANLPYNVASPLLRKLLDLRHVLADWSVMLQREMADRLVAQPRTKDYGSLTVLHALCADVSKQLDLNPGCFFPAPKVGSSFVRVWPRPNALVQDDELPHVERVVRTVFNQRRKTILNGLRGGGLEQSGDKEALEDALARAGISPGARAETLPPDQLLELARELR